MSIFTEFPYTNFHEMNLDWILKKMKELVAEWLSYKENMDAWRENMDAAFEDLKAYVNDYFASLDISAEIEAKLQEMIDDGTLADIINVQIFGDLINKVINVQNWSESEEDLEAYREDVRRCAANYLMYEYGSNSVVNDSVPALQKVCWKYNTNYGYMAAMGRYLEFKYTDTEETPDGTLPVVYADCAVFTSLINKCRSFLESPYYYAVNTVNPDPEIIFNKSMENGDIYDKPYTFDFLNNYNTNRMSYITERSGIEFWQISDMNQSDSVPTTMNLDKLKTGDIIYRARSGQAIYKGIDHCGTFIKTLDELATAAGVPQGVTFQAYNGHVSDVGYIIEFTGSAGNNDYTDCLRLTAIEDWFTNTIATHSWIRCYAARPISCALTSNKAYARLTGIVNCYDYTLNVLQERGDNGEFKPASMVSKIAGGWILKTGQDLNDLRTDGVYKCNSAEVAATILNKPGTGAYDNFTLINVGHNKTDTYGIQICFGTSITSYQYAAIRSLANDTWSPWVNICTLDDVSSNIGVVNARTGLATVANVPAEGYKDMTITFSNPFPVAPRVFLQEEILNNNMTGTPYFKAMVINASATTTSFRIRVFNTDSAAHTCYVRWFAQVCEENA